jgi:chitodextrinase
MPPTFTTKGYIEVWSAGRLVSQHTQETKAVESLLADASTSETDTTYELRFPLKIVKVPGVRHPRTDTAAPTVPLDLTATVLSSTSVRLDWEASTDTVGVAGYQVWRNAAPIETTTSLSYTAIGLTAATAYEFNVSAYDAAGNMSALSETVTATTSGSSNAAPVWQSIAQQELTTGTNYSLPLGSFVSDPEGQAVTVTQVSGVLPPGVTYNASTKVVSGTPTATSTPTVTFRASDGTNTADISIVFNCLGADTTAPSVPAGLAGTGISRQRIDLTWSASTDTAGTGQRSSGLAGYRLYRDGSLRTTLGLVTSYSDTGLAAGTSYSYTIAAVDVAGNASAQSAAVVVATAANALPDWVTPAALSPLTYPLSADVTMRLLAVDPDGDPVIYSYDEPLPIGFTITELTNPLGALLTVAAGTAASEDYAFTAHANDESVTAAEADWIARSTGPGVVWAHDFRYQREVDQFRLSDPVLPYVSSRAGNDPDGIGYHTIFWDNTDGIGNSRCVRTVAPNGNAGFPDQSYWVNLSSAESKVVFPAGTTYTPINGSPKGTYTFPGGGTYTYECLVHGPWFFQPTDTSAYFSGEQLKYEGRVSAGGWARPFSALVAGNTGNGLPEPDRASGGETHRTFDPSSASAFASFTKGFYGHSSYHTAGGAGSSPSDWDGTEFYLQFRVKLSAGRHDKRTPPTGASGSDANVSTWLSTGAECEYLPAGKLAFIQPGPDQQDGYVIVQSGAYQRYAYETAPFRMYSYRGSLPLQDPQSGNGTLVFQNTGPYAGTCNSVNSTWNPGQCWEWPEDEWVTVLFYMKPGRDNAGNGSNQSTWPYRDTHVKAWVAREGETSYTPIFDKADLAFNWDGSTTTTPAGSINNVDVSCYMNNLPGWKGWEQKYTQVIFSKQFIECPQV